MARLSARSGASALVSFLTLVSCGNLIGLNDLHKADCVAVDNCSLAVGGDASAGSGFAGTAAASPYNNGGSAGTVVGSGGTGSSSGGTSTVGGGSTGGLNAGGSGGAQSSAGAGGLDSGPAPCPGGAIPPATWTEHWFEHNQVLKRVYYDDCVALYFDNDMDPAASTWLSSFISKAWKYSLATYGKMGPDRVFSVFHQAKYSGGHSAAYYEASHDLRNTTDAGQTTWTTGDYDMPAHLLGFVVAATATHTKYGSPAGPLWGNESFSDIYKYDLYVALGMTAEAKAAYDQYTALSSDSPVTGTFWFRDWFYPIWRDHGHAQATARFFNLLQQYYPTGANNTMPDMNWGEYVHFMSGAANADLKPLATQAFGWPATWETQYQKAKLDYPAITY